MTHEPVVSNHDSTKPEKKDNKDQHLNEKYSGITSLYDSFFQIVSLGDVASIYRNRPCFHNHRRQALVKPATEVFLHLPSSRPAVYYYTGLLVHDSVNTWFNKKENVPHNGTTAVNEAACRMLEFLYKFFSEPVGKADLEDALTWLCEISAALSAKNATRPSLVHLQTGGEEQLAVFKSIEIISKMISLVNLVASSLLSLNADSCLRKFFDATRHGSHFAWMWLHVASLSQGNIITHVLESGSEQFKSYVAEFTALKSIQVSVPNIAIVQTEYEHKFGAISEMLIFLMRKRNPDLQDAVSTLIENSLNNDAGNDDYTGFAFFFKLLTLSMKTLQILVTCNSHLITPYNAIRAFRQIRKIDKAIILPTMTSVEYIKKVVEEVDPVTHGKIFEMIIEIVYDQRLMEGENKADFEHNMKLRQDCLLALDIMVSRIVRIAHATGPFKCPSQHPAISAYSAGNRLQFILSASIQHVERPGSLIRHLHAIAIANGEWKAAEIALRFLMTANDSKLMSMFITFLSTTAPFFPSMMDTMFREFSALRTMIEISLGEDIDKKKLQMTLLANVKTLFDWEAPRQEKNLFSYVKVYPGKYTGDVLNILLTDSVKLIAQTFDMKEKLSIFRAVGELISSVGSSNSREINERKLLITLSEWYRLVGLLAIVLKSSLLLIGQKNTEEKLAFEKLRSAIFDFLYKNHIDGQLIKFFPIFLHSFSASCLLETKRMFGEQYSDSAEIIIDESGLNKLLNMTQLEEGPSVLEGLRSLKMKDSALDMLHSGRLKRRRTSGDFLPAHWDDTKERVFVALDTISYMCFTGPVEICLSNSKQLALTILHKVCKDSLSVDMRFDEWDIESEFIHRHVEVDQRINQSTFFGGVLRVLSETRSFAYCLPIMKSMLAVIINETEKFPERSTCSKPLRAKFHSWMMLAHRGGILPNKLIHLCDLERYTTVHETNLIALEVWKLMMGRNLSIGMIDIYQEDILRGQVDEGLPNENEAISKVNFSLFRLLIQNHLPESFHLFPKFFPTEYDFYKLNKFE